MATDPHAGWLQRRRWLQWAVASAAGACSGLPVIARAAQPLPRLFAAWDLDDGRHQIGRVVLPAAAGAPCRIDAVLDVPTRAHGLVPQPDGSVLVAARRPGEWLLRWRPDARTPAQQAQWHWIDGDRAFNGHVQPQGPHVYTTESDLDTGAGLLVQRDARSLERLAEWPTGGTDNHMLLFDGAGGVFVANGGVATRPETGRTKIDLAGMDSSLARIDVASGRITQQWRVADQRLSLRHLAWRGPQLGIALQAQHDDPAERQAAPVLAWLAQARGGPLSPALQVLPAPQPMGGYGGDICATPEGFAVSCPRVDAVARWAADGRWQGARAHGEAYALAATGAQAWVAGPGGWLGIAQQGPHDQHPWRAAVQPDNHAAFAASA